MTIISLNRRNQEEQKKNNILPRRDQELPRTERTKQLPDTFGIGCLHGSRGLDYGHIH